MALFSYEAFSKDGKKVKGVVDAPSANAVKELLTKQGLFPIKIEAAKEEARLGIIQRLFMRGVSTKNKILFTKQLAVLLKSGVPLLQALELLTEQVEGRLRVILVTVKDDVKGGTSLADALAKYPKVFENIYIQLVRAGEASGKLEVILERLTSYLERREQVSKKIRSALQYPIMQLVIALGVVVLLLTYIVPQMTETFVAEGKELPFSTEILITISNLLINHYLIILIVTIIAIVIFRYWKSTQWGARMYDAIKLRLPIIGYLTKTSAVVQFSYTLGMLLEGGVNLAQALDIVVAIIDNRVLAYELAQARDKIIKQGNIAQFLQQTGMFPGIAIYLIRTGEQTGQLDAMLLTVAQNYEVELTDLADRLTGLLGPIMLVVMAVIVGFIVMSVALPIVQMGELAGI